MPFTIPRYLSIDRLISVKEKRERAQINSKKDESCWQLLFHGCSLLRALEALVTLPLKQLAMPYSYFISARFFEELERKMSISHGLVCRIGTKGLRNSAGARSAEAQARVIAWTAKRNKVRKLGPIEKKKKNFLEHALVQKAAERPLRRGRTSSCDRR